MPPCPTPPPAKTVYIAAVGKRLVERHGERPIYTPEDVVAAAEDVIRDWPAYEDIGELTFAPDRKPAPEVEPEIEGIPASRSYSKRYRTKVLIKRNAQAIREARRHNGSVDWDCHALAMFCEQAAFDAFHAARGETCDYTSMRAEMTAGIAEEKVWPEGLSMGALGSVALFDERESAAAVGGVGYGGHGSSTWFEDFFDGFGGLFEGWFDDWW